MIFYKRVLILSLILSFFLLSPVFVARLKENLIEEINRETKVNISLKSRFYLKHLIYPSIVVRNFFMDRGNLFVKIDHFEVNFSPLSIFRKKPSIEKVILKKATFVIRSGLKVWHKEEKNRKKLKRLNFLRCISYEKIPRIKFLEILDGEFVSKNIKSAFFLKMVNHRFWISVSGGGRIFLKFAKNLKDVPFRIKISIFNKAAFLNYLNLSFEKRGYARCFGSLRCIRDPYLFFDIKTSEMNASLFNLFFPKLISARGNFDMVAKLKGKFCRLDLAASFKSTSSYGKKRYISVSFKEGFLKRLSFKRLFIDANMDLEKRRSRGKVSMVFGYAKPRFGKYKHALDIFGRKLRFKEAKTSFFFSEKVLKFQSIDVFGKKFKIFGKGILNRGDKKLDFKLICEIKPKLFNKQAFKKFFGKEPRISLPLRIYGDVDNPKFSLNFSGK